MNELTVAVIGNPNSGKTTLFNQLTGSRQKTGNWPGVTVDWKKGELATSKHQAALVDLPGVYHLTTIDNNSMDEAIALNYLHSGEADAVINTVDATNLERNLYLTVQLREMGVPVIIALTMNDIARRRGLQVDRQQLSRHLQCPVVDISGFDKQGYDQLKQAVDNILNANRASSLLDHLPDYVRETLYQSPLQNKPIPGNRALFDSLRYLEGDYSVIGQSGDNNEHTLQGWAASTTADWPEDADIVIADARYQAISHWVDQCVHHNRDSKQSWSELIDKVALNRFLGIPVFLMAMYAMFFIAINVGSAFQEFFETGGQALFVDAPRELLTGVLPSWLVSLVASGIGMGLTTTVTFIPVIGFMFLCLAFLESSGYMARASFVVDRFMRSIGLPGKAFVPMIVGFGCNVPAVMATRTLQSHKDRVLTILMTPFMSCGARLAIYAVFTSAFFAHNGANIVFLLYLIGIVMAVATGFILRHTLLKGENSPLITELPPYHKPKPKNLLIHTWQRLEKFIKRAGKVIVPVCLLIGTLNSVTLTGQPASGDDSVLARFGQAATPVFYPMGVHQQNWPATVGLATGTLAKEVVVGTLDSLYSQQADQSGQTPTVTPNIGRELIAAFSSVPQNLAELGGKLKNPILGSAEDEDMSGQAYGQMHARFGSQAAAFSYLLFVLLYFPCISTVAATVRELNRGWTVFAVLWSTGLAYGCAVCFYQAATWSAHPVSSSLWLGGCAAVFLGVVFGLKWHAQPDHPHWPAHNKLNYQSG